jgi:Ca2+-binding RTX toxin-like protein
MLAVSLGPLMVVVENLTEDDDAESDEVPVDLEEPRPSDEDFLDRVAAARDGIPAGDPFEVSRGTEASVEFVGDDDVRNVHDASGGDDTLTGGMLDDTLIGGGEEDSITGGDGDDALFGGFQRASRTDDLDADTLDGGEGDDTLFLGNDDTAIGGLGNDAFVFLQELTGNATVQDFDPDEDALIVESTEPDDLEVTDQTVDDEGLTVTLNTGGTITLTGLQNPLDSDAILFASVTPIIA